MTKKLSPADRVIVALDVPTLAEARALVDKLSPVVRTFKVGKELFTAEGPSVVKSVVSGGSQVFLDLKFHDIPNTVASACVTASRLGAFMINVHASGGKKMMSEAAAAVKKQPEGARPYLIGVTVLTSMSSEDLAETGVSVALDEQVARLARLAKESGLDGVVASGREIAIIRKAVPGDFLIVTPGVRPAWAAQGDQKRVVTPREAIEQGADFIVVGRPITQHPDPRAAAEKVLEEIL